MTGQPISDQLAAVGRGHFRNVPPPVGSSLHHSPAPWPALAAPADEPEPDAAERLGLAASRREPDPDGHDAAAMEHDRQSRLRRWQAER